MDKIMKKTIALVFCITFIISAVGSSNAINIHNNKLIENIQEKSTQKVTLIRYGPDGTETPIDIELDVDDEQKYIDAIVEKCEKLLENDFEIQKFFKDAAEEEDSPLEYRLFTKITSTGRGKHYKTGLKFNYFITKRTFLPLPKINLRLSRAWVICNYNADPRATTKLTPMFTNDTLEVNGNHSVLINQFVGFALWVGKIEKSPFDVLPRVIVGNARFVLTSLKE